MQQTLPANWRRVVFGKCGILHQPSWLLVRTIIISHTYLVTYQYYKYWC